MKYVGRKSIALHQDPNNSKHVAKNVWAFAVDQTTIPHVIYVERRFIRKNHINRRARTTSVHGNVMGNGDQRTPKE